LTDKAKYIVIYLDLSEWAWGDIGPALRFSSHNANDANHAKNMCRYKNKQRHIYDVIKLEDVEQDD